MITDTKEITNSEDVIDVRDVIARVEELEEELDSHSDVEIITDHQDEKLELSTLTELLDDLAGNGGDEEWRGAWYPITLVRDSYFKEFARHWKMNCKLYGSGSQRRTCPPICAKVWRSA